VIGGTGLFAALTDSAHTGTNSIDSAALPNSADLQLATGSFNPATGVVCGTFSDDLATGLFNVTDMNIGSGVGAVLCIQNVGSAGVTLTAVVDQLTDVDTACTGDEADYGDTTCGGNGLGELSAVVETTITEVNCFDATALATYGPAALSNAVTPGSIGTLGPGIGKCYMASVTYSANAGTIPQQQSQSDRVTWRYVFTAQAV
jgi:hypothetical protein